MRRIAALWLILLVFASCRKASEAPPVPPPPVNFAVAEARDVPLTIETFGNCVTIASVTLQAQVTGTLLKYAVREGAIVKQGDLIAEIDPGPYQAALQEAQGSLDSARAQLANAEVTLTRQQALFKTKTIDLADLQTSEANQLQAQGAVLSAEGELANAKINLGYCTVSSPINGKAGIYQVDAGNLVTANTTKLMNIQTLDPIYIDFTVSENDFDKLRKYFAGGELDIEATIPGAPEKPLRGKLTFIDNAISSGTGTLMLRATFANPEAVLWPGLFVNVRLILTILKDSVVIPAQCVMVGQKGPYVFVVNADNTVTLRLVRLGQSQGDFTVVAEGVTAGEKIVTAGQLGLDTGLKVSPSPWSPPSATAPAAK